MNKEKENLIDRVLEEFDKKFHHTFLCEAHKDFIKQTIQEELQKIAEDVIGEKIEMLQTFRGVMGQYNCSSDCVVSKKFFDLVEKEINNLRTTSKVLG